MNRKGWFIPILIIVATVLAIGVKWSSLPELLPAHFDLEGNASGTMTRGTLLLYPLVEAVVCLISYLIARKKEKLQTGLIILASGISLILLSSAMVTLTSGTMPVFMLAEPFILLGAIAGFVTSVIKARKSGN